MWVMLTVMLSSPPRSLARSISWRAACQPIAAEKNRVAWRNLACEQIHLDAVVGTDTSQNHISVGVSVSLLGSEGPFIYHLGDQTVILRDLVDGAIVNQVGPAVAHVGHGQLITDDEGGHHSGGHLPPICSLSVVGTDGGIRGVDCATQAADGSSVLILVVAVDDSPYGILAGYLTGSTASHPVRQHVQPPVRCQLGRVIGLVAGYVVLIMPAPETYVG
jgi:hypothetical protein